MLRTQDLWKIGNWSFHDIAKRYTSISVFGELCLKSHTMWGWGFHFPSQHTGPLSHCLLETPQTLKDRVRNHPPGGRTLTPCEVAWPPDPAAPPSSPAPSALGTGSFPPPTYFPENPHSPMPKKTHPSQTTPVPGGHACFPWPWKPTFMLLLSAATKLYEFGPPVCLPLSLFPDILQGKTSIRISLHYTHQAAEQMHSE